MERKRITCPETAHLEEVELERTPSGIVITGCSRFQPGCAVDCARECARRMDLRARRDEPKEEWSILGFTLDDIVGGWQDARLAGEFVRAFRAAGSPSQFEVLRGGGSGAHILWFVNAFAAHVLDEQGVRWRTLVIGTCDLPPADSRPALAG